MQAKGPQTQTVWMGCSEQDYPIVAALPAQWQVDMRLKIFFSYLTQLVNGSHTAAKGRSQHKVVFPMNVDSS